MTLRTLYRGCRGWTFNGFTNNDAAVSNIEWQRNEIRSSGHGFAPCSIVPILAVAGHRSKLAARVTVGHGGSPVSPAR